MSKRADPKKVEFPGLSSEDVEEINQAFDLKLSPKN